MNDGYGHREIWRIAAPMILSAVTTPLLGMVDTAVVGHLEAPYYLGAVAAGATIFTVLFMGLNFLRMGTTGITAQAYGADDNDRLRESLGQAGLTALGLAALLVALRAPLLRSALWLLAPSAEVAANAAAYFEIRIWSAPASLLNFVLIGWLLGMQNARGPLAMMLSTNLTNIALDLLFVVGLGLAARGVALATLLAELVGLGVGAAFVAAELRSRPGDWTRVRLLRRAAYQRLFDVNVALFFRTMALMFVFSFITAQGARMGDVILAANAVLMNLQFFLSYALDGIANAAEALVGKAVGACDRAGLLIAVRRTLAWSLLLAAAFSMAYLVAGNPIIELLTDLPRVRAAAREYLPWLIASPLISVWSFLYDGVYVGATRSREMMVVMVGSAALLFLPAWLTFQGLGNHALWLAFTLFMAGRALGMHGWYRYLVGSGALVTRAAAGS